MTPEIITTKHGLTATLYRADCLDVLPTLGKVDAVITDPPYGVNLGKHDAATEKRPQFLAKQAYASYDDTPENFAAIVAPAVRTALERAERGLVFAAGSMLWELPRANAVGAVYLPAACGRNPWGFASVAHFALYGIAPNLEMGAKHTAFRSTKAAEKNGHPCPKPVEWMEWCVNLASRKGHTVLDPFMGSGTTGVAALRMGCNFIGIEIEPKYYAIAKRRIAAEAAQGKLFA
jgi:site-specific DNA-methyltransferase (adenine-specific)